MSSASINIIYDSLLSDEISKHVFVSKETAERVFEFFKSCPLFKWNGANNDCEDRANAIGILLDKWNIPNYKAWIFGGSFLKKNEGSLKNNWGYHVAAVLPVGQEQFSFKVIDPSTSPSLQAIEDWAMNIAESGCSYYAIKRAHYYIFPPAKMAKDNWFVRCSQNYKWTIQGLAGINGVSQIGKAQICFNKTKIRKTEQAFKQLLQNKPAL